MKRFLYIVLLIFFIAGGLTFGADEDTSVDPNDLQTSLMQMGFQVFKSPVEAPDFALKSLNGDEVTLSSFKGTTVLLNFWATWCPPCRAEMPSMEEMYGVFKDEKFEILAVDLQESVKTVQTFIDDNGYTFPILLDSNGRVASQYGARSIPTTYLIDENGMAIGFIVGSREWNNEEVYDTLREVIGAE